MLNWRHVYRADLRKYNRAKERYLRLHAQKIGSFDIEPGTVGVCMWHACAHPAKVQYSLPPWGANPDISYIRMCDDHALFLDILIEEEQFAHAQELRISHLKDAIAVLGGLDAVEKITPALAATLRAEHDSEMETLRGKS